MKTLVALSVVLFALSSFGLDRKPKNKELLACNLSFGPDQQVVVVSTPDGLILRELTNSGSMLSRDLSQEEWDSGVLQLRTDSPIDSGTLTFENGEWFYDLGGAAGYAECTKISYQR
jgi:hypothetical protein